MSRSQLRCGALVAVFAVLWLFMQLSCAWSLLATFCAYLCLGGWRFARVFCLTALRDLKALRGLLHTRLWSLYYARRQFTVADMFSRVVARQPDKLAFQSRAASYTFSQAERLSNAVANYFLAQGFGRGDVVVLFMESSAEYPLLWLGLSKLGVVSALVNHNLRREALCHCIDVAKARAIIYSSELGPALAEVGARLGGEPRLFCWDSRATSERGNDGLAATDLAGAIKEVATSSPQVHGRRFNDKLLYIYTSGTTGMPKAAKISNARFFFMSNTMYQTASMTSSDVLYMPLPLYHSAGGILGVGFTLLNGCTGVVKPKFSASQFWPDCIEFGCTAAQYIGETCRYQVAQPPRPTDTQHKVRVMFGNGLRPTVWKEFQPRFKVKHIVEFYGSTEGNCNLVNVTNVVGSVGFITRIAPFLYPVGLILMDEDTGKPVRGPDGLCVEPPPGVAGQLVGRISRGDASRDFEGYIGSEETNSKVARDVFRKGDSVFLTGDVLEADELGNLFFKDRTGDTFRWKGENVSTTEVEGRISNGKQRKECTVYGVEVHGYEGRAGMAAILDKEHDLDLDLLARELTQALPSYARPIFVRIVQHLQMTSTHKYMKVDLRRQAFDPSVVSDPLYVLNAREARYLPLDEALYNDVRSGKFRL